MESLDVPVDLIWGERDPWEPIAEARRWEQMLHCIQSLSVIPDAGHCPHDEAPNQVNLVLQHLIKPKSIQQAT